MVTSESLLESVIAFFRQAQLGNLDMILRLPTDAIYVLVPLFSHADYRAKIHLN